MKVGDLVRTKEDSMGFPAGSLGVLVSHRPQQGGCDAWCILMAGTSKPKIWVTMKSGIPTMEVV